MSKPHPSFEALHPPSQSLFSFELPKGGGKEAVTEAIKNNAVKLSNAQLASVIRDYCECVDTYIFCCDLYEREGEDPDSFRSRRSREREAALAEHRRPQRPELKPHEKDTFNEILSAWDVIIKLSWPLQWAFESRRLDSSPVLRTASGFGGAGAIRENNYGRRALLPHWSEDKIILKRIAAQLETVRPAQMPMVSMGNRNYAVGDNVVTVEETEDKVLQVYFVLAGIKTNWIGLDKPSLTKATELETAPRILRRISEKYAALAPAIDCPGKRGQGGLKVYVGRYKKPRKK